MIIFVESDAGGGGDCGDRPGPMTLGHLCGRIEFGRNSSSFWWLVINLYPPRDAYLIDIG